MDFRQLQYMLKVAEEKSFSKAAQKLYIAQPSLSQYIQKLENQLGVQLFDRSTSPLQLTYAGELYAETAKRILDLNEQLLQQMEDIADLKKGRLIIGLSHFRSTYIMPRVLPIFHKNFPEIEIVLVEGVSSALVNFALNGTTDISLMALPVQKELFSYEPVFTEELLLAVPQNHPLCKSIKEDQLSQHMYPKIHLSDLKNETFIMLKPHQKIHEISVSLCRQAGFKPKILIESESIDAAHALTAAGMGITFVPDILTLSSKTPENPVYFSLDGQSSTRTITVAYRKGRYLSKAAREFINLLKEIKHL